MTKKYKIEPDSITISPSLGTGWATVVDQTRQEIRMQLKLLGLPLPLRRRFLFSQVARVRAVSRPEWGYESRASEAVDADIDLRGFRFDLLMTIRGGKTLKLGSFMATYDDYIDRSIATKPALEIEREMTQRLGLREY